MFKVILFGQAGAIAEVSSEAEARDMFAAIYNVDTYDAEDGPRVGGYDEAMPCIVIDGVLA